MTTPPLNLPTFRRGGKLLASDLNAVVRAIRAGMPVAGPGMLSATGSAGVTLYAGVGVPIGEHLARIVNVRRTDGAPETDPGRPSAISYDITLFGRHASASSSGAVDADGVGVIEDLAPTLGRPHMPEDGDHVLIHPAFIGQPCKYVVTPVGDLEGTLVGELWVLSERVAYGVCEAPGG